MTGEMKCRLGQNGPIIPRVAMGCMAMSGSNLFADYAPVDPSDPLTSNSLQALEKSLELGCNLWDTGVFYRAGHNEQLLSRVFSKVPRDQIVISSKFGVQMSAQGLEISSERSFLLRQCKESLKNLGITYLDIMFISRVDNKRSIEEAMENMVYLQKEGLIKHIGLSEVSEETLRRAVKVAPVAAIQEELSLWSTGPLDNGLLKACEELNVSFFAYSPLGRGFLTGSIKSPDDLAADDFRRSLPRYQGEAFHQNLKLVEEINTMAKEKGITASQLSIAWLLHQSSKVVVLQGSTKAQNVEANIAAQNITLTEEDLQRIQNILKTFQIKGTRYPEAAMHHCSQ